MEIERLSIVIDTNLEPLQRGVSRAIAEVCGFSSEVGKAGNSAQRAAVRAEDAFGRILKAIREARREASNGAEFKVSANVTALAEVVAPGLRVGRGLELGVEVWGQWLPCWTAGGEARLPGKG